MDILLKISAAAVFIFVFLVILSRRKVDIKNMQAYALFEMILHDLSRCRTIIEVDKNEKMFDEFLENYWEMLSIDETQYYTREYEIAKNQKLSKWAARRN